MVVSEIKFSDVPLKMLCADVLVDTAQATLENAKVVLDSVGRVAQGLPWVSRDCY